MKNRNMILGFIFIVLGCFCILDNFDMIDFKISFILSGIADLWPLFLVVIGINLIVKNKTIEKILWILVVIIIFSYSFFMSYNNSSIMPENSYKSIILEDKITEGKADLDIGATQFDIISGTTDFSTLSSTHQFDYEVKTQNTVQTIYISNSDKSADFLDEKTDRSMKLNLNESIPWNFDINCGAVNARLDLKNIDVQELNLDAGAGRIQVDLGRKSKNTDIHINSGVSQIVLNIPRESGLKVTLDGALNSTNLRELDLIEKSNHFFLSDNYNKASSNYNIDAEMGVGNFKINYY